MKLFSERLDAKGQRLGPPEHDRPASCVGALPSAGNDKLSTSPEVVTAATNLFLGFIVIP